MKRNILGAIIFFVSIPTAYAAGVVEQISTPYHVSVSGWACDSAAPDDLIEVEVWRGSLFVGSLPANGFREPAVATACGSSHSNHGFNGVVKMPVYLLDGGSYPVQVFGRRSDRSVFPLTGSPQNKTFAFDLNSSQSTFLFQQGLNPLANVSAVHWDPSSGAALPEISLATFNLGNFSSIPSWSVSSQTGLTGVNSELAVSPISTSSALQVKGDQVGVFIDTATAPVDPAEPKKVINFIKKWNSSNIRPWGGSYGENASLCTGFHAAVPVSSYGSQAGAFASTAFYLWDLNTGSDYNFFVYEVVYYFGGGYNQEWIRFDAPPGVGAPHVLTYAGPTTRWATTGKNSNYLQASTWTSDKYFSFCVSKEQMSDVVKAVNKRNGSNFSVEKLHLDLALMGAEVSTAPYGASHARMAARYGQWFVRMLK